MGVTPLGSLARTLERAGVPYAVIGGHAVNVWLEPRFTADVDITVQLGPHELEHLAHALADEGYAETKAVGRDLRSGPDFIRFVSRDGAVVVELQVAKTALQADVIRRAQAGADGVRIATPEDLIVLKLIADRPKDRIDLLGLARLPSLDWEYIERWASEWDVLDVLRRMRVDAR